ncbi:hypothetical protein OPV22_024786 [Ensete ventricosum]|uniref:Uncharacterized protein n=1 Tax=Ensete ventricosum TaxID=4639 RepID=A0AAV8QAT5_ENSVE|nr:hypothetical protein OPV22_024786 [Ensete ventricosum]
MVEGLIDVECIEDCSRSGKRDQIRPYYSNAARCNFEQAFVNWSSLDHLDHPTSQKEPLLVLSKKATEMFGRQSTMIESDSSTR